MDIYDTIEFDENYPTESLEKTGETSGETYDDALSTYQKKNTSEVSKYAIETLSETYDDALSTYQKKNTNKVSKHAKETLSETYDDVLTSYPKGNTSKVSKCATITLSEPYNDILTKYPERDTIKVSKCATETLSESYDGILTTYPKKDTIEVSECACVTPQKCLLLFAMMGVFLSLASLGFAIREKVEAVDGFWSAWESWDACSVTCDVGMQRRQRHCSNPVPLGNGRQCLGVDIEHKLCFPGPCSSTHGGWSRWGYWGRCSASCNGGVRSRFRTCTDPVPSLAGSYCEGNQAETVSCNNINCEEDFDLIDLLASITT